MSKRKDMTGQIFGELTVIKFAGNDPETRSPMWLCCCSCGIEKVIHGYALVHGIYKSCGCRRIEKRDAGAKKHIENDTVDGTRVSALKAKLHAGNKSGVKGIMWMESRNKWKAYIGFQGKQINLGYYEKKEDAIASRKAAEEKYHVPYLKEPRQP